MSSLDPLNPWLCKSILCDADGYANETYRVKQLGPLRPYIVQNRAYVLCFEFGRLLQRFFDLLVLDPFAPYRSTIDIVGEEWSFLVGQVVVISGACLVCLSKVNMFRSAFILRELDIVGNSRALGFRRYL